ncbi:hypothetical protein ACQJBY_016045 [Aegilops geniculata]
MHAPDSSGATTSTEPSPKAPAEETHAPPAGPEGSEETALRSTAESGHTVTEEDHVTSPQPHEDLPSPAGRNEPREGEVPSAKDDANMGGGGSSNPMMERTVKVGAYTRTTPKAARTNMAMAVGMSLTEMSTLRTFV